MIPSFPPRSRGARRGWAGFQRVISLLRVSRRPFSRVSRVFCHRPWTNQVVLARWSKRDVAIGRETKAHQIAATSTSVGYAVGFSFIV